MSATDSTQDPERQQRVRARVERLLLRYPREHPGFAPEVLQRLRWTELKLSKTPDGRDAAETVHEIEVGGDMLNGKGTCHGGCMAWLLDVCTSYAVAALGSEESFKSGGISTDIAIRYLAPGKLGDTLVITSRTLRQGKRFAQAAVDFRLKDGTLVATGTHAKMDVDPRQRASKL